MCWGGGAKHDLHRKFIAALLGAVQFGSGADSEDLLFEDLPDNLSVKISTRFSARWGEVILGGWMLREDDPESLLKNPELHRLENGSPEEKDVLRRRVVMESIARRYKERAFIINVVGTDGTIYHLGLDLGVCLRTAYIDGKLVVRNKSSDALEAFIDKEGAIITIPEMSILYVKDAEDVTDPSQPEKEELELIKHKNGHLVLTAPLDLIKEISTTLQGIKFKETPFQGNPTDVLRQMRCVPTPSEMIITRDC